MFSLISYNDRVCAQFNSNAGKVAITSVVIALIVGVMIYNVMGGPESFLPEAPVVGYILSGLALLFIFDAIKYTRFYYKTPAVAEPKRVTWQEITETNDANGYLVAIERFEENAEGSALPKQIQYGVVQTIRGSQLLVILLKDESDIRRKALQAASVDFLPIDGQVIEVNVGAIYKANQKEYLMHVRPLKGLNNGFLKYVREEEINLSVLARVD